MRTPMFAPYLIFLFACSSESKDNPTDGTVVESIDEDGDGFLSDEDCDDSNSQINPNTPELCDGIDNNCDGNIDEDVLSTFYADSDEDGFGSPNISIEACSPSDGFVSIGTDCNDSDANTYPGAEELCDGVDNNCDDTIDEGLGELFYVDEDRDGFGDENQMVDTCQLDVGLSTIAGDCDDTNANISPIENEFCDDIDNNCDGNIDEDVTQRFYLDTDGDSFGSDDNFVDACEIPEGYVTMAGDCDDTESFAHPSAFEICDAIDNNCDGNIDESGAIGSIDFFEDYDGDGFGNANITVLSCTVPTGYTTNSDDCNDTDGLVSPDGTETCNQIDDNCDGTVDEEAIDASIWNIDYDSDGFGSSSYTVTQCTQPTGYVADSSDCDDTDGLIFPGAAESCNQIDDDCDGVIDNQATMNLNTYYEDTDEDGYGVETQTQEACTLPSGYAEQFGDCDDENSEAYPSSVELCNEIDDDCDGIVDESDATDAYFYYADIDLDGYGDDTNAIFGCAQPNGYVENNDDCNDASDSISPAATELCNSTDDDCNGIIDDPSALNYDTYYEDNDGDGFGSSISTNACSVPTGYSTNSDDCDDDNIAITPFSGCLSSCSDILDYGGFGATQSGNYSIDPDGYGFGLDPFLVSCDMTTDDGGWIKLEFANAGNDLVFSTNPDDSNNGIIRSGDQARYYQHLSSDGFDTGDFLHNANGVGGVSMTTFDINYYNTATGTNFTEDQLNAIRDMVTDLSEETKMIAGSVDDSCVYSGTIHSTDGMGHEVLISNGAGTDFILLTYGTQPDDEQDSFFVYHTSIQETTVENVYMGCGNDTPITHLEPEYLIPAQIQLGWNATNTSQWGGAAYYGSEQGFFLVR